MIALLVMTDGRRELFERTMKSAFANLTPWSEIGEVWVHDDSGDPAYQDWLALYTLQMFGSGFPQWHLVTQQRSGFAGAIRNAWSWLRKDSQADYVFHLEDDFLFNRPVPLPAMRAVLDACPNLVQLALRRQAWNDVERVAGGVVESRADQYAEREMYVQVDRSNLPHGVDYIQQHWLEHRLFFTTNPSLYRRSLIDEGWPDTPHSEGEFTQRILRDRPAWRFGFYGARNSGEWVHHIGEVRAGNGY